MSVKCRRGLAVVLAVGLLAAPAWAAKPSGPREQLQQTRKNLRQEQNDLKNVQRQLQTEQQRINQGKRQERSILKDIQIADQHLEEAEDRYAESQRNLALVRENLKNIRAAIHDTEGSLSEMRGMLAMRLRLLYREGSRGLWRVLVTSSTLSEALSRLKFFRTLAAQNAYWVERLSLTRQDLARQKLVLAERETQARDLEEESRAALGKVKARKAERETMLARVRTERTAHEEAVRELTTAAKRLNDLVSRLERKARELERKAAEAERQKQLAEATARKAAGKPAPPPVATPARPALSAAWQNLPWPTRGRVTSAFGKVRHPRFNTYIYNKGIDIAGPMGQNVTAVAPGKVLFAEWFEGYGRMVILDHGDGLNTVYAHLAKITVSEGQTVTGSQAIGTLGDSGTWKGPSLYFEIRQRGQALDPLTCLQR